MAKGHDWNPTSHPRDPFGKFDDAPGGRGTSRPKPKVGGGKASKPKVTQKSAHANYDEDVLKENGGIAGHIKKSKSGSPVMVPGTSYSSGSTAAKGYIAYSGPNKIGTFNTKQKAIDAVMRRAK